MTFFAQALLAALITMVMVLWLRRPASRFGLLDHPGGRKRHGAAVPLTGFVIPGSTEASARLDVCRTVCRRAERRVVALARQESVDGPTRRFVNRLSDLLFMIGRYEEKAEGAIRYKRGSERNSCGG